MLFHALGISGCTLQSFFQWYLGQFDDAGPLIDLPHQEGGDNERNIPGAVSNMLLLMASRHPNLQVRRDEATGRPVAFGENGKPGGQENDNAQNQCRRRRILCCRSSSVRCWTTDVSYVPVNLLCHGSSARDNRCFFIASMSLQ